jgi:hypothetical protein
MNLNSKKSFIPKIFIVSDKYKKWFRLIGTAIIYFTFGATGAAGIFVPYLISYLRIHDEEDIVYSDSGWGAASDSICFSLTMFLAGILFARYKIDTRLVNLVGAFIFW